MSVKPVKLEVHICNQRRSYYPTFVREIDAISFINRFTDMNHAFYEPQDSDIPESWATLLDILYPTCEHGLSASLCMGSNHYERDC